MKIFNLTQYWWQYQRSPIVVVEILALDLLPSTGDHKIDEFQSNDIATNQHKRRGLGDFFARLIEERGKRARQWIEEDAVSKHLFRACQKYIQSVKTVYDMKIHSIILTTCFDVDGTISHVPVSTYHITLLDRVITTFMQREIEVHRPRTWDACFLLQNPKTHKQLSLSHIPLYLFNPHQDVCSSSIHA